MTSPGLGARVVQLVETVLADFEDYCRAQQVSAEAYRDKTRWNRMALLNTAGSGVFAADRSIRDYSDRIWHCRPVQGM